MFWCFSNKIETWMIGCWQIWNVTKGNIFHGRGDIHITILVSEKWAIVGKNWHLQDIKLCLEMASPGKLHFVKNYNISIIYPELGKLQAIHQHRQSWRRHSHTSLMKQRYHNQQLALAKNKKGKWRSESR